MFHETEPVSAEAPIATKTILIVEDECDIGSFLTYAIEQESPHHAVLVIDPFQALTLAKQITPDLVLLNYLLPGMNGLELYDQLHTTKGLETVPAIMVSATLPRREMAKRGLLGIQKPFDLDDLFHLLEQVLR